jgi:hypothetical protein
MRKTGPQINKPAHFYRRPVRAFARRGRNKLLSMQHVEERAEIWVKIL